jgi:ribosome-binding factor A
VSELLRGEVAEALRREVADPRVRLVTITKVDVAPDFSQALVFWSTLDPKADVEDVQKGLNAAAAFMRGRLAQRSQLKRMPRLEFRHDATLIEGDATLALLREIADGAKS